MGKLYRIRAHRRIEARDRKQVIEWINGGAPRNIHRQVQMRNTDGAATGGIRESNDLASVYVVSNLHKNGFRQVSIESS